MRKNPLVSIIIANFNGEKYLSDCLTSVVKTKYADFEVIIVDDGSVDNSEKIIKSFIKKDSRISLLKNERNLGAAASRNKALHTVAGEIIVFLDNDTQVDENWISEIVKTLNKGNKIGACQALIMDFEDRNKIQMAGAKLWAQTAWGLPIGQWSRDIEKYNYQDEIIAISAALAIKKTVLDIVGGFDEQEAVVTEDLDLSWRIWLAGYTIVRSPESIVYHWTKSVDMRKNMKHNSQVIYFHLTKNSMMSILKNYEFHNALKYLLYSSIISVSRAILSIAVRHDIQASIAFLKAILYILKNMPSILRKRSIVQHIRRVQDADLFGRIIIQKGPLQIYKEYFTQTSLL